LSYNSLKNKETSTSESISIKKQSGKKQLNEDEENKALRKELIDIYPYCGNYFITIGYWFKFIETMYMGNPYPKTKRLFVDLVSEIFKVSHKIENINRFQNTFNNNVIKDIILRCFERHNYFDNKTDYYRLLSSRELIVPKADQKILKGLLFPMKNGDLTVNRLFTRNFLDNLFLKEELDIKAIINAELLVITEIFYWAKTFVRIIIISRQQHLLTYPNISRIQDSLFYEPLETDFNFWYNIYSRYFTDTLGEVLDFEDFAMLIDMINRSRDILDENDEMFSPVQKKFNEFINKVKMSRDGYEFKDVLKWLPVMIKDIDWDSAIDERYGAVTRQVAFRLSYRKIRETIIPMLSLEDILETCLTCYDIHNIFDTYMQTNAGAK